MEEKYCKNCLHFHQYYTKGSYKFLPQQEGFCSRKRKYKQHTCNQPACELWEINEEKMKYREERVTDSLKQAMKHIKEIYEILKY